MTHAWLRGNTSRRHRSWLRGAWPCTAGHPRWRWRGRYLGATDLGSELGAKICGSDLGAVDLGSELRAMDPGAELDSKPMAKFPLLRLLSCIISENILRSRQALDSAFSVFGFDVRKAKFQIDPWQCLQRVWIWSSEHRGKCSFLLVKILGNGSNSRALCKTVTLKWGLLLPAITEVYCIEHGYDCQITLISWALNCDCASPWFSATNSEVI